MSSKKDISKKIQSILDEISPYLKADNGGVELVECTSHKIKIRFTGTCKTCDMQYYTFKAAIEETIKSKVPEISEIEIIN